MNIHTQTAHLHWQLEIQEFDKIRIIKCNVNRISMMAQELLQVKYKIRNEILWEQWKQS